MAGVVLSKEDGKLVARCSGCGEILEKTTKEISKLMETGKLKKVSGVCDRCAGKFKFSLQFSGVEHG